MVKCTCLNCGITFEEFQSKVDAGKGKFHSKECQYNYGRETRTCLCGCGKTFTVKKSSPKQYFNKQHFYFSHWGFLICEQCGRAFPRKLNRIKNGFQFHNDECSRLYYKLHPETRADKISIANTGRKITWADKISKTLTGTTLPEAQKKKISETCKIVLSDPAMIERTRHFGSDNGMWNNGASYFPYPTTFNGKLKGEVLSDHDDHCAMCGKTSLENGRALPIHHIDYDKTNSDPNNLLPLCDSCHGKTIPVSRHEYYYKICRKLKDELTRLR